MHRRDTAQRYEQTEGIHSQIEHQRFVAVDVVISDCGIHDRDSKISLVESVTIVNVTTDEMTRPLLHFSQNSEHSS